MSGKGAKPRRESRSHKHGNLFSRDSGSMLIHMQRESGLAHRTLTLRPWQVQLLRIGTSRWFLGLVAVAALSWLYFASQTARIPLLTARISHLEDDARRLDTLQVRLTQLQARYDQVQKMLSAPGAGVAKDAKDIKDAKGKKPDSSAMKAADTAKEKRAIDGVPAEWSKTTPVPPAAKPGTKKP